MFISSTSPKSQNKFNSIRFRTLFSLTTTNVLSFLKTKFLGFLTFLSTSKPTTRVCFTLFNNIDGVTTIIFLFFKTFGSSYIFKTYLFSTLITTGNTSRSIISTESVFKCFSYKTFTFTKYK